MSFTERGGRKERVPNTTRQSQALYQAGGMTDGKIRDKPKRADQTGKAGKQQMEGCSLGRQRAHGGRSRCMYLLLFRADKKAKHSANFSLSCAT